MTKAINLIFPHQLLSESPVLNNGNDCYLIEEYLFFRQYRFHRQKLAFHRASMKAYQGYLEGRGITVHYIESGDTLSDLRTFGQELQRKDVGEIYAIDPTDDWLEQRLRTACGYRQLQLYDNPLFLNSKADLTSFFRKDKKSFFQTTFYKQQRKERNILMEEDGQPAGGRWTFDAENRKKYPKGKTPPKVEFPGSDPVWEEAVDYVSKKFDGHPGHLSEKRYYPVTIKEAGEWLEQFLAHRFHDFGAYEDAIVRDSAILHHSVLSPLMNVGLLLPQEILEKSIAYAEREDIPINSTEGFVRQIIGWREFIRGMYECKGRYSRTRNFWEFDRKIPESFYTGTTGIDPIDDTIKKVLETGYCHHIERLMVLGNFMLLCEFDPDEVYRWFMELFIDAYDWVMVPNVYGMCLFADGGTFATKPYIGGSNYIRKMSDYPKGDWEQVWDGLFWRFVMTHEDFFSANPRTAMLVHSLDRMSEEKKKRHREEAETFLQNIGKAG